MRSDRANFDVIARRDTAGAGERRSRGGFIRTSPGSYTTDRYTLLKSAFNCIHLWIPIRLYEASKAASREGLKVMKSSMVPGLIAAVAAMAFIAEGRAETPSTPKTDRGAIEKIVRDYLVEHPEIIEEALKALPCQTGDRAAAERPGRDRGEWRCVAGPPDDPGLWKPGRGRYHRRVLRLPVRLLQTLAEAGDGAAGDG